MQILKGIAIVAIVSLIGLLNGCSSEIIGTRIGADRVSVADASQVANCQSKGEITVSVLANVGFINRSVEAVDANLLQMAKNAAVDADGDTVVKGARPEVGKRTFAIYKCRP
jgi:hypothetical protein